MFLVEPRNKKTPEAPPEDNAVETDELDANVQQLEVCSNVYIKFIHQYN